jgi:hypothetical protein
MLAGGVFCILVVELGGWCVSSFFFKGFLRNGGLGGVFFVVLCEVGSWLVGCVRVVLLELVKFFCPFFGSYGGSRASN